MDKLTKKLIKKAKKRQKHKTMDDMEAYYINMANIVRSKAIHHMDEGEFKRGYLKSLNDFAIYSTGTGFNDFND